MIHSAAFARSALWPPLRAEGGAIVTHPSCADRWRAPGLSEVQLAGASGGRDGLDGREPFDDQKGRSSSGASSASVEAAVSRTARL